MVMAVASVTGAQVAFDTTNLQVLLAACAGVLGAAVVGLFALFGAHLLHTLSFRRTLAAGFLAVGGVVTLSAPNIIVWGVGLFISGLGVGMGLLGKSFEWGFIRGLIIGPSLGAILGSISWRIPGGLAVVTAVVTFFASERQNELCEEASSGFARPTNTRQRILGAFLVFVASTMFFPAALFYFRNETLLQRSPLPFVMVLAIGGLLGLWRGRKLVEQGLARRSIRQGAWLVILFGVVGSTLTRNIVPDFISIPFALLFAFGTGRVLASAVALYEPFDRAGDRKLMSFVVLGAALAVVPLATAGNESLLWQVREVKQSYPNTPSLESLDRGILSLPVSFDVAQDPRLGALSGPMRAAATFMTEQHLYLTITFSAGIAAILAFLASLALPRQRSIKSLEKRRQKVRVDTNANFAVVKEL
jgi:hypothetical protein